MLTVKKTVRIESALGKRWFRSQIEVRLQVRQQPLRFLPYLEWSLFAIVVITEFLPVSFNLALRIPALNLVSLIIFAGLGLFPPTQRSRFKFFYTTLEFGVLFFAAGVSRLRLFSLLFIVIVIRSSWMFQAQWRAVITVLAFMSAVLLQIHRAQSLTLPGNPDLIRLLTLIMLGGMFLLGLVLLFLQLLVNAVLSERKSQEQLALANAQLRNYALRIEDSATLQERNRIARDIHDSIGHNLMALNLHLEAAIRLSQVDLIEAKEFLLEAKQLSMTTIQEVRQSVTTLRANPLQGKTLETVIRELVEEFQRSTQITTTVYFENAPRLPNEIKIAIYRIVQEGLTNIYKHAQATEVVIELRQTDELSLRIWDNGHGFERSQTTTGFGLQGMRERTLALDGHFELVTDPNQGCEIRATFPTATVLS